MSTISTINVPFHGANLCIVNHDGNPYVPMKPIIEGMGLDWASQFTKLKKRFSKGIVEIAIPSKGGEQSMICLSMHKLTGWLYSIMPNKVKPEIRDKVIKYQEECDDVLYEYWTTGEVKKKTNFRQSTAKELIPLRQTAERLIAHGVGNIYPDIWKHIHKEFGVEHINELLPEQIPLAISYLDALEGEYIPKQEENILFEPNQNSITVTIPKEGRWLVSYKNGKQQVVSVDGHNVVSVEYIQKLQRDSNALIELLQNFRLRTQVMQGEKSGDILNTPLIA
ncbi:phage antirepressor N-terminal domain-containing protein [Proteus mirabilis]|uniref:phage antirepressor N-terminal domain-containing protein n=1 Tax=Proteus mirabilis TaxID=584 RepID=UPI0023F89E65|nr:phage antirepressor N-terminal domain-containing protein [Proteus mirabilis]MDF7321422.1 phage antirepressor N-terminal domain-containing protein [Proteus mirabilis]